MKKIKLVYCTDELASSGGMQKVLTMKANYLADRLDYDVTIILTDQKKRPFHYDLSPNIKTIDLDINFYAMYDSSSVITRYLKYFWYMRTYEKRLSKVLIGLKPDITISLLRREINFINNINDGSIKIGEIHFDKTNYRQFNSSFLPKCINNQITHLWRRKLFRELNKLKHFIVLTHEDYANWTELNNRLCIPNPIVIKQDQPRSDNKNMKVIAVGRYTYQKGFDRLFKAWKIVTSKHPSWILNIYGDGDKTEYQNMVNALGLESTCILNKNVTDIYEKMAESSIFVLSSRYEGFGLVLIEAMSCGLASVAFNCPCGPKDIITDGANGLLVENGNIEELANKISYLIEKENIRQQIGMYAITSITKYDIHEIMNKWHKLFKELV